MFNTLKDKLFHPYDRRPFIKRILGYCGCPYHKRHWFVYPSTIRMNTMYQNEESNWITVCEDFYESEIYPQIKEDWDYYYSTRL